MGLDPALAVSLLRGEQAAAHLAAIPDSVTLRAADEATTRGDQNDDGAASIIIARMDRMAALYRDGAQPDLDNASLAELFAFCFAMELARGNELNRYVFYGAGRIPPASPSVEVSANRPAFLGINKAPSRIDCVCQSKAP